MDYNITVELDGSPDPEKLAEQLYGTTLAERFHLGIQSGIDERVSLNLTVDSESLDQAIDSALDVVCLDWRETPFALAGMPADEHDRRNAVRIEAPAMLGSAEVAEALGVSPQRVRQLLDSGKLPGRKVGRDWLVSREAVQQRKAKAN
jgi:excisionase family DNA binding protein